jgi:excisionase family DNA binding protein
VHLSPKTTIFRAAPHGAATLGLETLMNLNTKMAFLTPEEMAAKLRISIRKLQQMVKDGTAPKHMKLGAKVLFVIEREGGSND